MINRKWLYSIAVTPVVPIRAVLMISAYLFEWLFKMDTAGRGVPGWRR